MRIAAMTVAVSAGLMWGASIINIWTLMMPGKGATVLVAAAVTATVIAAMLWCTRALAAKLDAKADAARYLARTVSSFIPSSGSRGGESLRRVR